ncbi:hypothetical protein K435DRAFT_963947 [Dendrothele bispora CBS 962.96]|uniref:Uncharacterized protein n=1 Tax=Dendrothele bispora (strain CBS 962.96) TaxID=1314807 RepID=A0A4S8MEJ4_DENBC|nr:hypothetical protein K435DRAFT_963947 [Dendrothele bispora CBS 962.96]
MTLRVELPLEIFPLIFFFLRDDTRALSSCCRLNQSLLPEAAKHLYRRVSFAHPARTEPASALLPRYRDYVRELDFGFLFNNFESEYGQVQFEALCSLISTFAPNVQMVMFECICPTAIRSDYQYGSTLCPQLMQYVLQNCPQLIDVHIQSLMTFLHPDLLRMLAQQSQSETGSNKNKSSSNNLRKIRLEFADHRIINDLAAPWSQKLVENLEELELTDHGQDVYKKWEAQSLMTIFSRLQNIRRLVLCENFNDVDELLLLAQLPNLRDLTLFYHKSRHTAYNPKTHPHFTLRSLTILCSNQQSTDFYYSTSDQIALAKYIIFLITPSPSNVATYQNNLEHLSLLLETQSTVAFYLRDYVSQRAHGPNSSIGFDSIIDHLIAKHSHSLKFLYLRFGFIKKKTWLRLAEGLPRLEELVFAGCKDILHSLNSAISTHLHSLRFLQIKLRNIDHFTRTQIRDSLSESGGREACNILAGCQSLNTLVVDSSRFDKLISIDPDWNGLETEEKWVYTAAKRKPNQWFHRFGGPLIN